MLLWSNPREGNFYKQPHCRIWRLTHTDALFVRPAQTLILPKRGGRGWDVEGEKWPRSIQRQHQWPRTEIAA